MFNVNTKKPIENGTSINTIIGDKSKIKGTLTVSESTRIDGFLDGKILSESTVIIGEHGMIKGNIEGFDILVAGTVHGNIQAAERIRITSTGRVFGDIFTKTLMIDEGASFKGNCQMDVSADTQADAVFAAEDSQWDDTRDIQPEYELVEETGRKNSKRA